MQEASSGGGSAMSATLSGHVWAGHIECCLVVSLALSTGPALRGLLRWHHTRCHPGRHPAAPAAPAGQPAPLPGDGGAAAAGSAHRPLPERLPPGTAATAGVRVWRRRGQRPCITASWAQPSGSCSSTTNKTFKQTLCPSCHLMHAAGGAQGAASPGPELRHP